MLRYLTAGESHGKGLIAILEGMVAGLPIDYELIDGELKRRQFGYGRGGRMAIEADRVEFLSGIRRDQTIGSPIAMMIQNRDFKIDTLPVVTRPRPGHADLAGALKYHEDDIRNILERASARETVARVAVGAICKLLLREFAIDIASHVIAIGGIETKSKVWRSLSQLRQALAPSKIRCADREAETKILRKIKHAQAIGDTLGGVIEVIATGAPVGLGSHVHGDRRLDARIGQAILSIQAIKAVEMGEGTLAAGRYGSEVHDEIYYSKANGFYRKTNRAGGIEGGMTNGSPIVFRAHMKPLSTLRSPLASVDLKTKQPFKATVERSDACAVPAAGVICEAVLAFELASAFLEKFGGDSLPELRRNVQGYLQQVKRF